MKDYVNKFIIINKLVNLIVKINNENQERIVKMTNFNRFENRSFFFYVFREQQIFTHDHSRCVINPTLFCGKQVKKKPNI